MPRKAATDPRDTLQAIRDAAFRLFGRYGYEGVSIGDIARAAKVSKGALYWHFHGKEALFVDCLEQLHALYDRYIFDPMRRTTDPVHGIAQLFVGLGRMVQDERVCDGIAGYWMVPPRSAAAFDEVRARFEQRAAEVIRTHLAAGEAAGRFHLGGDLDRMARAIITVVEAGVLPLRNQPPAEVHENLGVLARTLFRAYASEADLRQFERLFG